MITVVQAPPFATIQDLGRFGYRDIGIPVSGVADRESAAAINALLGNDPDSAMIEWAVAGGTLRFDAHAELAIGGAESECMIDARRVAPWTRVAVQPGALLQVGRIVSGRFLLIAVRGGIDVPVVLGSRSTLLSAKIGGLEGRRLRNGDRLNIGVPLQQPGVAVARARRSSKEPFHVLRGPQGYLFGDRAWSTFLGAEFRVSNASDRTGYRLEGPAMQHLGSASLPSEPACVGAIQIPDGGAPIVIMHDGPTVGGYPKIAVLRHASLSRFAQLAPGDAVGFVIDGDN